MGAPKGNKFAEGNRGGAPRLYKTYEELQKRIDDFFLSREEKEEYPTITGLAHFLGFESRQSFYDYEKHEEFSYLIKRARLHVESYYESRLYSQSPTGAIFALKNMGWIDKSEVSQTNFNHNSAELTQEQMDKLIDKL